MHMCLCVSFPSPHFQITALENVGTKDHMFGPEICLATISKQRTEVLMTSPLLSRKTIIKDSHGCAVSLRNTNSEDTTLSVEIPKPLYAGNMLGVKYHNTNTNVKKESVWLLH